MENDMTEGILRICFEKKGDIRFISHLDVTRLFVRAMTRAGIPMRYSEGFSPHPRFTFALPLSVGMESVCELADFYCMPDKDGRYMTAKEAREALAPQLAPCGIKLISCEMSGEGKPLKPFSAIRFAVYRAILPYDLDEESIRLISGVCNEDKIVIEKRTKNGMKETDIRPLIGSVCTDGPREIRLVISAAPDRYLNPEYVISYISGLSEDLKRAVDGCSILRTAVIFG